MTVNVDCFFTLAYSFAEISTSSSLGKLQMPLSRDELLHPYRTITSIREFEDNDIPFPSKIETANITVIGS